MGEVNPGVLGTATGDDIYPHSCRCLHYTVNENTNTFAITLAPYVQCGVDSDLRATTAFSSAPYLKIQPLTSTAVTTVQFSASYTLNRWSVKYGLSEASSVWIDANNDGTKLFGRYGVSGTSTNKPESIAHATVPGCYQLLVLVEKTGSAATSVCLTYKQILLSSDPTCGASTGKSLRLASILLCCSSGSVSCSRAQLFSGSVSCSRAQLFACFRLVPCPLSVGASSPLHFRLPLKSICWRVFVAWRIQAVWSVSFVCDFITGQTGCIRV